MKVLSLIQPYATAIILGNKKIETRSWKTKYRGKIAIHAAKTFPKWAREFAETERALGRVPPRLPFGAIIGFAHIHGVFNTEYARISSYMNPIEKLYGDYSDGRYAWILDQIEPFPDDKIIPYRGQLGLFDIPDEVFKSRGINIEQGKQIPK